MRGHVIIPERPPKWEIGQIVFMRGLEKGFGHSRPAIKKIARRWVYLDNGERFDRETGLVDGNGYSSSHQVHVSEEEARKEIDIIDAWNYLRQRIPHHCPKGFKMGEVEKIARTLRIDMRGRKNAPA